MLATDRVSVAWIDCQCMVLFCMDDTTLVIFCPKHGPAGIKTKLVEQEKTVTPIGGLRES